MRHILRGGLDHREKRYTHKISLFGARFCSYTLNGLHKDFGLPTTGQPVVG